MGVQNLWMLLAPVGRQIEIETLASQVLAVDASIWLTQFVKAMRDDEGNMIKNAHLIGTFHRVAKLLFYRVRPVFVFDGNTPEIKKRTVAKRRKRQEHQAANLKQTAQRILLNRLKLYREELKKNGGKPRANPAVDPNFLIPGVTSSVIESKEEEEQDQARDGVITIGDSDEDNESETRRRIRERSEGAGGFEDDNETKRGDDGESDDDQLSAEDIDLDTSRMSRIDLDAVFALPTHLQKDMIARIQRDRRQEARDQFIPLAGNPEAYSRTQISSFLKTSKLNRQIDKARKKNAQLEMAKAAATVAADDTSESGKLLGQGKRIASSSDRFFILEQAKTSHSDEESDDDERNRTKATQAVHFELTKAPDSEDVVDSENDEDVFARIHGSKRKRHFIDENTVVAKKSLGEFSISSVKEVSVEMNRSQRRKIAVQEARRKFLEKEKYKQEEKPLAIELARRARNEEESTEQKMDIKSTARDGLTITIKPEEITALDQKVQELFPASMFMDDSKTPVKTDTVPVAGMHGEDDDEVDWEDVPTVRKLSSDLPVGVEPVSHESALQAVVSVSSTAIVAEKEASAMVVQLDEDSDDDVEWETAVGNPPSTEATDAVEEENKTDVVELDQESSEEEVDADTSDLYASLQYELEEEKAEEDLSALKQEALQSAIATASNLTQWAAGAVRRALAEHTRHRDVSTTTSVQKISTPEPKPLHQPAARDATTVIDLSEDSEIVDVSHKSLREGLGVQEEPMGINEEPMDAEETDDRLLQLAIEQSMAETSDTRSTANAVGRYLQYTPVAQPEPEVDVAALAEEQRELKKLRNRQMRGVEGMSEDMVQDVMELLRLFGVPYLVCPMEAEAQCAALEQLGLVDGIITDDSDIFVFGGKKVYKNIFHNQKFVEAFFAQDVERELGFSQDEMIALALLLGSDYTDGIRGIGIVNASEVVTAYPGVDGLKDFKQWVQSFDVAEEARRRVEKKKSQAELDAMSPRERFEYTHASARRKWELGDEFPNQRVVQAYTNPQVDRSEARFSWELPDLAGLRTYCTQTFGWEQSKTDAVLLPLMEQIASFANGNRQVQTRIDQFFTKYDDNVKYASIRSKRLRSAVEGKTGKANTTTNPQQSDAAQSSASSSVSKGRALKSPAKKKAKTPAARATRGRFTKTKKTTSTLGM